MFVAPNFAIGAVLMQRFAARRPATCRRSRSSSSTTTRRWTHPAGPRVATAERIAAARRERVARARRRESFPGARGADGDGVRVHSVRLPGPRRAPGGHLRRARADAHDPPRLHRPRLVHAGRADGDPGVGSRPGLTVGLEPLLEERMSSAASRPSSRTPTTTPSDVPARWPFTRTIPTSISC